MKKNHLPGLQYISDSSTTSSRTVVFAQREQPANVEVGILPVTLQRVKVRVLEKPHHMGYREKRREKQHVRTKHHVWRTQ